MVASIAGVVTTFIHVSEHSNVRLNMSRKHILTTGQRLNDVESKALSYKGSFGAWYWIR